MPGIRFVSHYAGVVGGVERYMERTARLLRADGFRVDCCYAERTPDADRFLAAFDASESMADALKHASDYDLTVLHKVCDAATVRAFRESGPTAVFIHDHEYYCPRLSYYYPVTRRNCSRVYGELVCGCCAMLRRPSPENTFRNNFTAFAALWREVRACDRFIVLSQFMRGVLIRQGIPEAKITVIPPSIDIPAEASPRESASKTPRLLSIGQLIKGKGVDLLLDALRLVKTPFVLDVVGTGNDEANLKRQAKPLGASVVFHGFSPSPDEAFRGVRAVVLPWRWQEPFGLVGPESLAHGVPIVGFDVGAVREYLEDGRTGLLVPSGDVAAFARAVERLLNDASFAAELGSRGRELVASRFTASALLEGWRQFIGQTSSERSGS